jgi:hypothetical protein
MGLTIRSVVVIDQSGEPRSRPAAGPGAFHPYKKYHPQQDDSRPTGMPRGNAGGRLERRPPALCLLQQCFLLGP